MKHLALPMLTLLMAGCTNLVPERIELAAKDTVLLIKDSDGDGVSDYWDRCANTPLNSSVTSYGCPGDQDGDGVADYKDECRDSDPQIHVCEHGCESVEMASVLHGIERFASDSSSMGVETKAELVAFVRDLANPSHVELEVIGHTDSVGAAEYNQQLSERRAKAVAVYIATLMPDSTVVHVSGAGELEPISSNESAEGRSQNRRVEIFARHPTHSTHNLTHVRAYKNAK